MSCPRKRASWPTDHVKYHAHSMLDDATTLIITSGWLSVRGSVTKHRMRQVGQLASSSPNAGLGVVS